MQIETFVLGDFQSNCYLVRTDNNASAWLIDPGGDPASVVSRLQNQGLAPTAVLLTHCHLDHIIGVAELKNIWPEMAVICPQADLPLYRNLPEQAKMFGMEVIQLPEPDRLLAGEEIVVESPLRIRSLPTPGHSPGSVTYCLAEGDVPETLFSGDTLFRESIGRTDLWGGDWDQLENSIRKQLYLFPLSTRVLPGHGPETTIGWEREHNQFFRV